MASIDRYRPPREGYQPPTIPSSATRSDAPRSPTRRRDVPPPAPSPPTHTSRTSPPRPSSLPSTQSPVVALHTPLGDDTPPANQWYFTRDEVLSSPSILGGLLPPEERLRRAKGVNFIYQAGVLLDLPQVTLWVAGVFFHRFYMRYSLSEEKGGIHHYNIAATALFLANKTEENSRKTKDIIIAVARVAQKNAKLPIDEQSKEYWKWRDSILAYEELMLEILTFDLMVDNPYQRLRELLTRLNIIEVKDLRQAAWAFCNDACLTPLPLILEAQDVAVSAIFFASIHKHVPIDDVDGEPWWKYLRGDETRCVKAIEVMRQFYTENPLRKQNPSLPSPEFHLENTRRRGDILLSAEAPPRILDGDKGGFSPQTRANGAGGHDRDEGDKSPDHDPRSGSRAQREADKKTGVGPPLSNKEHVNGNSSLSGSKRKEMESDGESEEGRWQKRTRPSDDERDDST